MTNLFFDTKPSVSIILCTYNRAPYLLRCMDSVFAQTFTDFELVVVDDGSNDNTFDIVNQYIKAHHNIRYIKHQNRKLAFSKNIGIVCSVGRYITFLDSDDAYKPGHLETRFNYLKSHPDVDILQGGFYTNEEIFVKDYYQPTQVINLRECVLGPTFFGKREVFEQLNGFNNIAYGEDTDFWQRAERQFITQSISQPESYIYTRAETSITKEVMEGLDILAKNY